MSEQDLILTAIHDFKKDNSKDHDKIVTRLDKTNGRIKSLELWRAYLVGAWAILSLFLLPIVYNFVKDVL